MNRKLHNLSTLLKIRLLKKRALLKELKQEIVHIENLLYQVKENIARVSLARHKRFLYRSCVYEYDKHLEHLQREQTSLYKQRLLLKTRLQDSYAAIQKQVNQRKIIEKIRASKYSTKSTNN